LSFVGHCQYSTAYDEDKEAFNFAQQAGVFEVHHIGGRHGNVLAQVVSHPPIDTCRPEKMSNPINVIGNYKWYSNFHTCFYLPSNI